MVPPESPQSEDCTTDQRRSYSQGRFFGTVLELPKDTGSEVLRSYIESDIRQLVHSVIPVGLV